MAVLETTARANAALDELYRQHVGDVYRYTYAVLGNHADAEDVTQTTFVNALRALERGETPEDPSRWLIVIAHNLVRQRWRQAAARPALVELETDVPDSSDEDDAVELEELVRALQRIPETQREALVMRELEGRSYREIAVLLGLSTSALETLLFRARRSLADELENVVTCQNAELAISKRLDSRLSRKERRRLDEHLADCPDCARLAKTEARQRKAFKGLALLPLPIGLALFKGAPSAAAATSLPTIGLASSGTGTTATATGAAGAGAGTATGGAAVGGSLVGGIAFKVAAIAATIAVASGVGYKGVQTLQDAPSAPLTAFPKNAPGSAAKPKPVVVTTHPTTRHKASRPATHPSRRAGSVTGSRRDGVTPAASTSDTHSAATESAPSHTSSAPAHSAASPPVATHPAAPKPATTPGTAGPTEGSERSAKTPAPRAPAPGKSNSGTTSPAPGPNTGDASSGIGTSAPSGDTPPSTSTPSAGGGAGSTPGGPATGTLPASSPPSSPPSTPPVTTPPVTTPSSTPPTGDPSGGSSSGSTGDTSGSSDGTGSASEHPSSHAANPMERGLKLGLHKDENDDGHPSHP